MQKIIALTILSILSIHLYGQSNFQKFKTLFKESDTVNIKPLLAEWEKNNPDDPEFYRYYELTEKYGDEEAKQQARENIKQLRK